MKPCHGENTDETRINAWSELTTWTSSCTNPCFVCVESVAKLMCYFRPPASAGAGVLVAAVFCGAPDRLQYRSKTVVDIQGSRRLPKWPRKPRRFDSSSRSKRSSTIWKPTLVKRRTMSRRLTGLRPTQKKDQPTAEPRRRCEFSELLHQHRQQAASHLAFVARRAARCLRIASSRRSKNSTSIRRTITPPAGTASVAVPLHFRPNPRRVPQQFCRSRSQASQDHCRRRKGPPTSLGLAVRRNRSHALAVVTKV